jgi:hypothetical protein
MRSWRSPRRKFPTGPPRPVVGRDPHRRAGAPVEIDCDFCGQPFNPTATRWLCPRRKAKLSCCEGAPIPEQPVNPVAWALKVADDA